MYNRNEPTVTATSAESAETRDFTKTQWDMLGENKLGWKVATPAEAEAAAADATTLQAARNEYKAATGKDAPADASPDFLRGVASVLGIITPAAPAVEVAPVVVATAPEAEAADTPTAATYKRPRSTEDARTLYVQVTGSPAPDDATFATLTAEIEQTLGVVK